MTDTLYPDFGVNKSLLQVLGFELCMATVLEESSPIPRHVRAKYYRKSCPGNLGVLNIISCEAALYGSPISKTLSVMQDSGNPRIPHP